MGSTFDRLSGPTLSRATAAEILGYLGAAIGLAAAGIVLGEAASQGVQIVFDLVTAAALVVAGWALGGAADAYLRMKSVFWFLSVFLVADLAFTLITEVLDVSGPKSIASLTALVTAVYSLALWWTLRRSLQVLVLLDSTLFTIVALVIPDVGGFLLGPPDFTAVAIVTWLFGIAVVVAGTLNLLKPRRSTIAFGSIVAILGPLVFFANDRDLVAELLSLATACVLVGAGNMLGERGATGLGIAGALVVSAIIAGNHVKEQGPAIVILLVGLILVGGAIALARGAAGPKEPLEADVPAAAPPPPLPPPSGPASE